MTLDTRLKFLVVSNRRQCAAPLTAVINQSVRAGARAVLFREKDLSASQRFRLFKQLAAITAPSGCLLLSASGLPRPAANTSEPGFSYDGVHLGAGDPLPASRPRIVGRSCHSLDEVKAAQAEGCDYVTLSPVFATKSKPGYGPPLGSDLLKVIVSSVEIPVIALGGIYPGRVSSCLEAGAFGVAAMGAVMGTADPALRVAEFVAQVDPTKLER